MPYSEPTNLAIVACPGGANGGRKTILGKEPEAGLAAVIDAHGDLVGLFGGADNAGIRYVTVAVQAQFMPVFHVKFAEGGIAEAGGHPDQPGV